MFKILLILLVSLSLAACRAPTQTPLDGASMPGIGLNLTGTTCPSLIVTTGDKITWTNQDRLGHLIRIASSEGKLVFDSGALQPGDTTSFTFSQAGHYDYVCSSDRGSSGTITVQP